MSRSSVEATRWCSFASMRSMSGDAAVIKASTSSGGGAQSLIGRKADLLISVKVEPFAFCLIESMLARVQKNR